ncbi:hypothetical protein [Gluconobacter cerinus]|uniref:hypothetical protein n=1 Tax=Gluconobacter cerinus TaxID=38307 RepID=UPI0039E9EEEC
MGNLTAAERDFRPDCAGQTAQYHTGRRQWGLTILGSALGSGIVTPGIVWGTDSHRAASCQPDHQSSSGDWSSHNGGFPWLLWSGGLILPDLL